MEMEMYENGVHRYFFDREFLRTGALYTKTFLDKKYGGTFPLSKYIWRVGIFTFTIPLYGE